MQPFSEGKFSYPVKYHIYRIPKCFSVVLFLSLVQLKTFKFLKIISKVIVYSKLTYNVDRAFCRQINLSVCSSGSLHFCSNFFLVRIQKIIVLIRHFLLVNRSVAKTRGCVQRIINLFLKAGLGQRFNTFDLVQNYVFFMMITLRLFFLFQNDSCAVMKISFLINCLVF